MAETLTQSTRKLNPGQLPPDIIEHFHDEEELMLRINYPGYAAHVKEHNDFRNKINSLLAECKGKGIDSYLAIDVDKQMRKWLEHHIMKTDMAIVPFINR